MTSPGGYRTPSEQIAAEEASRRRYLQLKAQMTPQAVQNMAGLARENPAISPGALVSAGMGGIAPGTPAARLLHEGDTRKKAKEGRFSFGKIVRKAQQGVEAVGGAGWGTLKGISRGAFGILQGPGEVIQGTFRDAASDGLGFDDLGALAKLNPASLIAGVANDEQTTFGQMVRQVKQNGLGNVDVGSGFFLGGQARADQRSAAFNAGNMQINGRGRAITVGRYFAKAVDLEPGGTAFNFVSGLADAAVVVGADPSTYVAAPISRARQGAKLLGGAKGASKGFEKGLATGDEQARIAESLRLEIGAVEGLRNTVQSDRVFEWLTKSTQGRTVVDYLARETDFARAWDATKGKIDPKLLRDLTRGTLRPDEVIEKIGPVLGRTAKTGEKFSIGAVGKVEQGLTGGPVRTLGTIATAKFKRAVDNTRIFGTVPERVLPKDDLPTAIKNMDNFLKNAKVGQAERSGILARLADTNDADEMFEVATDAMKLGMRVAESVGTAGAKGLRAPLDAQRVSQLFTIYKNSHSDRLRFWQDELGRNKAFNAGGMDLDNGSVRALPHLASQFLDHNIPLPDPREIRAAISPYRNILSNKAINVSTRVIEKVSDNIFKPGVLLRPAYIARNQIDEQFRPAGMGLNSMFNHPVQYLSWLMHDEAGVGRALARAGMQTGRGKTDLAGEAFDAVAEAKGALRAAKQAGDPARIEEATNALAAARNARNTSTAFTEEATAYLRSISGGVGNWRNKTPAELEGSALFQRSDADYSRAMAERLGEIFHDPLAKRLARDGVDLDEVRSWYWSGAGQGFRKDLAANSRRMATLTDEAGARQYVDDTVAFIDDAVGMSPVLRQAAATGSINGKPLYRPGSLELNPEAVREIDLLKANAAYQGPSAVAGKVVIKDKAGAEGLLDKWDKVIDRAFYTLADRPTAYLSKSPVFRQRYYQRAAELVGFMDPAAQQRVLAGARAAKLKNADVAKIQKAMARSGDMGFEEADLVAKMDALDYTQELFYSLTNRSQFFDATRLLFPFGEAFKDSAVKYTQLVGRNPVLPYRLGQGIQGGRDLDMDGDGKGFLYTDDQTGEEMFAWPLTGAFEQLGVGQFRSPVKNLNILGQSVVPGFGPVVQIGVGKLLPDDPDFDAIRTLVNPYGDRDLSGGFVESFMPAWFSKAKAGLFPDSLDAKGTRAFLNAQKDVMGYLASTGDYDLSTPQGIEDLQSAARTRARAVFLVRGLAQAFAPSPPSPEFVAYDKDGVLMTQFKLAEEYKKIQDSMKEAGTPDLANRLFIERFGADAVLAAVSNTKSAEGASPVSPTEKAEDFFQANREAAKRHPAVFGLFAPDGEGDEFDFAAYDRQLRTGERVVISADEAVQRANQRVAGMIYKQAQELAGDRPSASQKAALKELKAELSKDYPGYSAAFNNETPLKLADLERAATDPDLAATPPGQALNIWLQARTVAEETAQRQFGTGWARSDKARGIRESMRALADELAVDFPGFEQMFDRALSREMVRDEPEAVMQ